LICFTVSSATPVTIIKPVPPNERLAFSVCVQIIGVIIGIAAIIHKVSDPATVTWLRTFLI
jgi:hypothetical protein